MNNQLDVYKPLPNPFAEAIVLKDIADAVKMNDGFMVHELVCRECRSICIVPFNSHSLMKHCPKCRKATLIDNNAPRRMLVSIVPTKITQF